MGGLTSAGSPVELPSDWDKRKRWRVVGPWVGGEEAEPITTHIISGDWEDSGGLVLVCVVKDAFNESSDSAREGGRAAPLCDNMSLGSDCFSSETDT